MRISVETFNAYVAGIRDHWNKGDRDESLIEPFKDMERQHVDTLVACMQSCPKYQILTGRLTLDQLFEPLRIARALIEGQMSAHLGRMMLVLDDYLWHAYMQCQAWNAEDIHLQSVVIRSTINQFPKSDLEKMSDKITVEDAQREWKTLVQQKKDVVNELDIKIKEAKERYQSAKAAIAKGK